MNGIYGNMSEKEEKNIAKEVCGDLTVLNRRNQMFSGISSIHKAPEAFKYVLMWVSFHCRRKKMLDPLTEIFYFPFHSNIS